jgi:hypothetical protein
MWPELGFEFGIHDLGERSSPGQEALLAALIQLFLEVNREPSPSSPMPRAVDLERVGENTLGTDGEWFGGAHNAVAQGGDGGFFA